MAFRLSVALLLAGGLLVLPPAMAEEADDELPQQWQEVEAPFPQAPLRENLLPLYVSAATNNKFFIDGSSLSIGSDAVIRYVMVVETPEGGRNVTFEGMRCETRERRIYASGRQGGEWSKWVRIQDAYANRQHAALFLEYFCPFGNSVRSVAEARDALVRGGHPDVRR